MSQIPATHLFVAIDNELNITYDKKLMTGDIKKQTKKKRFDGKWYLIALLWTRVTVVHIVGIQTIVASSGNNDPDGHYVGIVYYVILTITRRVSYYNLLPSYYL